MRPDIHGGHGLRFAHLLAVAENAKVLALLERYLLLGAAASVRTARSALEAIRVLQDRRTPIDCVICAHDMSDLTGIDFLQHLRVGRYGTGPSIRTVGFVLVLVRPDPALRRTALESGAEGVIKLPCDRDELTAAVVAALDARHGSAASASPPPPTERDWTQRYLADAQTTREGFIDHVAGAAGTTASAYMARIDGDQARFPSLQQAEAWLRQRLGGRIMQRVKH